MPQWKRCLPLSTAAPLLLQLCLGCCSRWGWTSHLLRHFWSRHQARQFESFYTIPYNIQRSFCNLNFKRTFGQFFRIQFDLFDCIFGKRYKYCTNVSSDHLTANWRYHQTVPFRDFTPFPLIVYIIAFCIFHWIFEFFTVCVGKTWKNAQQDDFDQQSACKAPVCWSKYTTLNIF